jgi:hypothetical protein
MLGGGSSVVRIRKRTSRVDLPVHFLCSKGQVIALDAADHTDSPSIVSIFPSRTISTSANPPLRVARILSGRFSGALGATFRNAVYAIDVPRITAHPGRVMAGVLLDATPRA